MFFTVNFRSLSLKKAGIRDRNLPPPQAPEQNGKMVRDFFVVQSRVFSISVVPCQSHKQTGQSNHPSMPGLSYYSQLIGEQWNHQILISWL